MIFNAFFLCVHLFVHSKHILSTDSVLGLGAMWVEELPLQLVSEPTSKSLCSLLWLCLPLTQASWALVPSGSLIIS